MVFDIRPHEAQLVFETRLVLEQRQSDPWLVLETHVVFKTQLLLEEIW